MVTLRERISAEQKPIKATSTISGINNEASPYKDELIKASPLKNSSFVTPGPIKAFASTDLGDFGNQLTPLEFVEA